MKTTDETETSENEPKGDTKPVISAESTSISSSEGASKVDDDTLQMCRLDDPTCEVCQ